MNNTDKALLSYLEGEIRCTEGGIHIMINEDFLCSISFPISDNVSINDMQKFVFEAIQEKRDRMKDIAAVNEAAKKMELYCSSSPCNGCKYVNTLYDEEPCNTCGDFSKYEPIEPRKEE
jgi:hypothetical protein